ncbi:hypothetical protein [Paraherbaspirillum soli]|uniref:SMODS and SLOG-associating 2TM effector domain-containing protein n=1 Tax=Paraherbaspirillum soli TaxID=631222 RepID=A0ABW0M8W4_9BURK
MSNNEDPVWVVYDLYKTARLNVKYYSSRLARVERENLCLEILIAITAPTSAVAGIWFFKTDIGKILWVSLSAIATIAAVIKPFLGLPTRIKNIEHSLSGYRALESDLGDIVDQIKFDRGYTKPAQKMFDVAQKRKKLLVGSSPENRQNKALIEKYTSDVNKELPPNFFFVPRVQP